MPIITLPDQLTIITSHVAAINRAMRNNNYEAIATFFEGIKLAAQAGEEYARGLTSVNEQTPGSP